MTKPVCSLLITDLDNTLWDWVDIWRRSFGALLEEAMRISGLPQGTLEAEIRAVHQKHRTAEYAFVLEELPCLRQLHPGEDLRAVYAAAYDARRAARNAACTLYPGVRETIDRVRGSGVRVVAYTESMAFYTSDRLRRTALDDAIDVLYSSPDHDLPAGMTAAQLRRHPAAHYEHRLTEHRHTPKGASKPNAEVLLSIMKEMGGAIPTTVYVGDSLMKDVVMAQSASIVDVWAKYGESRSSDGYDQLRRVTHWSKEDVEREKAITKRDVSPTHTIDGFADIIGTFDFRALSAASGR